MEENEIKEQSEIKNEKQEAKSLDIIEILKNGKKVKFDQMKLAREFLDFLHQKNKEFLKDEAKSASALVFVRGGKRGETVMQYEIPLDAQKSGEYNLKTLENGLVGLINEYYDLRYDKEEKLLKMEVGVVVKPNNIMNKINDVKSKPVAEEIVNRIKVDKDKIFKVRVAIEGHNFCDKGILEYSDVFANRRGNVEVRELDTRDKFREFSNTFLNDTNIERIEHPNNKDLEKKNLKMTVALPALRRYETFKSFLSKTDKKVKILDLQNIIQEKLREEISRDNKDSASVLFCDTCKKLLEIITFYKTKVGNIYDEEENLEKNKILLTNGKKVELRTYLRAVILRNMSTFGNILSNTKTKFEPYKYSFSGKSKREVKKVIVCLERGVQADFEKSENKNSTNRNINNNQINANMDNTINNLENVFKNSCMKSYAK